MDAPSHKPVPRTLSHGTVHPPGRQDEPQSGDALSPPLQRQLRGSTSTVPDPLTSQVSAGFQSTLLNQCQQAGWPPLTAEGTPVHGARGPHTRGALVGVPCPPPAPVPPQGQARPLQHTHGLAIHTALLQARRKVSGLGTQTWHFVGPVVVTVGAVWLRAGLEVLGHTR